MSRSGHSIHPLIAAPAGVSRTLRRQPELRYTIGFITEGARLNFALDLIGIVTIQTMTNIQNAVEELQTLERGMFFSNANGTLQFLSVGLLVWLGDHEEN